MPKIKKETIFSINKFPTLKIFKYGNGKNYYCVFYVGTNIKKSGNIEKSLKTSNVKEAEKKAKDFYKTFWKDINDKPLEKDVSFDKSIAQPFFELRKKKYSRKGKEEYYLKEFNRYQNYIKPFLEPVNYNETDFLTSSIEDLVVDLKKRKVNNDPIKDTTISKYTNLISLMCKFGQRKGLMKALPDIPTFSRINEERPPYFPAELRKISSKIIEEYKKTEDNFWFDLNDYVNFLRSFGTGRTGLNNVNIKISQCKIINDLDNPEQPILKITLFNTKNKPKVIGTVHNYWTNNHYFQRLKKYQLKYEDYLFFPKTDDRKSLYEKIRKSFVRVSSELGLYVFNGHTRPLYSIRHSVADKRYKETGNIHLVAEHLNTSMPIAKSNYLGDNDSLTIQKHKQMFPELYLNKSKVENSKKTYFQRNLNEEF
jgi:hypothetical protein